MHLVVLTFLIFTGLNHLRAADNIIVTPASICQETINQLRANNNPDSCLTLAPTYQSFLSSGEINLSENFTRLCQELSETIVSKGVGNARTLCQAREQDLDPTKQSSAAGLFSIARGIGTGFGGALQSIMDRPVRQNYCAILAEQETGACATPKPQGSGLEPFQEFFSHVTKAEQTVDYSSTYCGCVESKVKDMHMATMKEDVDQERKKINDLIFQAAGRKLLDSFAGNLEDVNFYLHNRGDIFKVDADKTASLQCNKAEDFQAAINERCGRNQVPNDVREKRISSILGSFGDTFTDSTLQGRFNKLESDIMNIKVNVPGSSSQTVSRESFDHTRYSVSKDRPEVKFFDDVVFSILKDPRMNALLEGHLQEGKGPGHAIKLVFDEASSDPKVKDFFKDFLNENRRDPFYQDMLISLNGNNFTRFGEKVDAAFGTAISAHPGMKAIFHNPNLFRRIVESEAQKGRRNKGSLLGSLEENPAFIRNYFEAKCGELKTFFAQAVCNPSGDFIAQTKADDLNQMLNSHIGEYDSTIKDHLICQGTTNSQANAPITVFSRLHNNKGDILRRSDYLARKLSTPNEQATNLFARYAQATSKPNSAIARDIQQTNKKYESERVSLTPSNDGHNQFVRGDTSGVLSGARVAAAPESISPVTTEPVISSNDMNRSPASTQNAEVAQMQPIQNFVNPLGMPTVEAPKASTDNQWRDQIRDYLAEGRSSQEVDKHLSNTSSADQQELVRLKAEIEKDREKMLDLVRDNDRSKIRDLENTYKELETRYNNAVKEKASHSSEIAAADRAHVNDRQFDLPDPRYVDAGVQDGAGQRSYMQSQSGVARVAGGSSGGTNSAIASRPVIARSTSSTDATPDSITAPVIIVSPTRGTSPQDASQELISYVNKNDLDVQTLKKMRDSGLVYKYKVMENGVEVEKEMKIDYGSLSPEARALLDNKIASQEGQDLNKLQKDYLVARRSYSFSTLKMILGIQAQKNSMEPASVDR